MRCIVNAPQPWARDERGAVVPARAGVRSPVAATMPRAATENSAVRGLIHLVLRAGGAFNARLRAHARIARLLAYLLAGATFWLFDLASGAVRDADASLADVAPHAPSTDAEITSDYYYAHRRATDYHIPTPSPQRMA